MVDVVTIGIEEVVDMVAVDVMIVQEIAIEVRLIKLFTQHRYISQCRIVITYLKLFHFLGYNRRDDRRNDY